MRMTIAKVDPSLQPVEIYPYPRHCTGPLIEQAAALYFSQRDVNTDRVYLPIFWTEFHKQSGYGKDIARLRRLVDDVKWQYPGRRFWTICQYDDSTLLDDEDTLVFGAGGNRVTDIPIPLLCDLHPPITTPPYSRPFLGSFVGLPTHSLRSLMIQAVKDRPDFLIDLISTAKLLSVKRVKQLTQHQRMIQRQQQRARERQLKRNKTVSVLPPPPLPPPCPTERFRELMAKTRFALAPRGYGVSSFRMYEALQMGVVPVYISDRFWLPFADQMDWSSFCVLVPPKDVERLPAILDAIEPAQYAEMQLAGQTACDRYFTMDGTCAEISRVLEREHHANDSRLDESQPAADVSDAHGDRCPSL